MNLAKAHPKEFLFFTNEVPDLPDAVKEIEKYLKLGGVIIAEQKFGVECDSPEMQKIYELATHYRVPVLMHWQVKMYNYGFERFYKMLVMSATYRQSAQANEIAKRDAALGAFARGYIDYRLKSYGPARQKLRDAVRLESGSTTKPAEQVALHYYEVEQDRKLELLEKMLREERASSGPPR